MRREMQEILDRFLPTEALLKGYHLTWWAPDIPSQDPVVLTKAPQGEVYRWGYIPTMGKVWDKIRELEG